LLDDQVLDQVLALRDPSRSGGPAPWHEIEEAFGVQISMFARLVIGLDAAEVEFANDRFERIVQAGKGRTRTVMNDKGQVVLEEVAPIWYADAWQLERMIPGFAKPRVGVDMRSDQDDVEAGYATFAHDLDELANTGSKGGPLGA
jgi:hypothetical protein